MPDRKNDLVFLRLKQAKDTIEDVNFLISNERYILAVNRIYYGMFYSLLAMAILYNFKTSKHSQIIGWFNKKFVKTGKFAARFSKILQNAFNARTDGDYGIFIDFSNDDTLARFGEMKEFISEVERFLNADLNYR